MPRRTKELALVSGFSEQAPKQEAAVLPKINPVIEMQKVQNGLMLLQMFPRYTRVPNLLDGMFQLQRQAFFDSLSKQYALQQKTVEKDRASGREKSLSLLVPLKTSLQQPEFSGAKTSEKQPVAMQQALDEKPITGDRREAGAKQLAVAKQAANGKQVPDKWHIAGEKPAAAGKQMLDEGQIAGEKPMAVETQAAAPGMPFKSISMPGYNIAESVAVQQVLGQVIFEYVGNNTAKAQEAINEFESRLKEQNYKSEDLMAVLLLVLEDQKSAPDEGGIGTSSTTGGSIKLRAAKPEMFRNCLQASADVRLASVREMLRYYFEKHPGDYCRVLASVLGVTADQENDVVYLGERLASEIAHIGTFALEMKILAEAKKMGKMDSSKCMRELGFKYDERHKKLIIGKRTCGGPLAPKDILRLLFSRMNKKNN